MFKRRRKQGQGNQCRTPGLKLNNKLEEREQINNMKQEETGRNRTTGRKKTPKPEEIGWEESGKRGRDGKRQEEMGRDEKRREETGRDGKRR